MEVMVSILLIAALFYIAAGFLFATLFLSAGIKKVDVTTHGSGLGFKLIILPGVIVFWPVLLQKWIKVKTAGNDKVTS